MFSKRFVNVFLPFFYLKPYWMKRRAGGYSVEIQKTSPWTHDELFRCGEQAMEEFKRKYK